MAPAEREARCLVFENFGIATAASMPMMTTTIKSSIRVKPRWRFRSFWIILLSSCLGKTRLRTIPEVVQLAAVAEPVPVWVVR